MDDIKEMQADSRVILVSEDEEAIDDGPEGEIHTVRDPRHKRRK